MEDKNQLKTSLLLTLPSLLGILLGGGLTYFFTLQTQQNKLWSDLRTKAYVDFIENSTKANALSFAAFSLREEIRTDEEKLSKDPELRRLLEGKQREADAKYQEASALRDAAKFAIGTYGSKKVVEKMAAYAPLANTDNNFDPATLALFNAMRDELVPEAEKLKDKEPSSLLNPIFFPSKSRQADIK